MARTGKIARLPRDLREQVNTALRDGATAAHVSALIDQAKTNGAKNGDGSEIEIPNDQNVTNWREGGYADWLREQERLEGLQAKREFALELVRQNEGSKVPEAAMILAASQISEVLEEFDVAQLKTLLAEAPENYAQVVNALTKLSKGNLDVQKFKDFVAERKREIEKAVTEGKAQGGFSTETIERIERELKLL